MLLSDLSFPERLIISLAFWANDLTFDGNRQMSIRRMTSRGSHGISYELSGTISFSFTVRLGLLDCYYLRRASKLLNNACVSHIGG